MLIITLGSQASGSTWLFNVVRELLRAEKRPFFSMSADEAMEALDQMPLQFGDVILKSHSLDQRLLRIAALAQAKIIISSRDPRDSAVSQRERFNVSIRSIASELSRCFASISALPSTLPVMRFEYEDRFMDDVSTIAAIAHFLELPFSSEVGATIQKELAADAVRAMISERLSSMAQDADLSHDPDTHWHPNHLGDGATGKWRERLDETSREIVEGCVSPMASRGLWNGRPLVWPAPLFQGPHGFFERPRTVLSFGEEAELVAWGPYLHLPCGHWRALPSLCPAQARHTSTIEVEAYSPWFDRTLASGIGPVRQEGASDLVLDFKHNDHFQPLELRMRSLSNASGSVIFDGWTLYWMGEL